jgi:hypothetical protein
MLLREKIGIYSENHTIHTNALCEENEVPLCYSGWYGELPQDFERLTADRNRKNDLWSNHLLRLLIM